MIRRPPRSTRTDPLLPSTTLFRSPCGAVDALQLFVLRIAAPVRTGNAGELERLEEARVRHVRAAAHVDVFLVVVQAHPGDVVVHRSEEHTSELQSLMRNSYAVFCLKKKK